MTNERDAVPGKDLIAQRQNRRFRERVAEFATEIKLPLWLSLSVLTVLGIVTAAVAAKGLNLSIVVGYIIMLVPVSIGLAKATRKISGIVFITTISAYIVDNRREVKQSSSYCI